MQCIYTSSFPFNSVAELTKFIEELPQRKQSTKSDRERNVKIKQIMMMKHNTKCERASQTTLNGGRLLRAMTFVFGSCACIYVRPRLCEWNGNHTNTELEFSFHISCTHILYVGSIVKNGDSILLMIVLFDTHEQISNKFHVKKRVQNKLKNFNKPPN